MSRHPREMSLGDVEAACVSGMPPVPTTRQDQVIALVEPIVEELAAIKRRENLAEGVRWRNSTMRKLRELLGKE